MSASTRHSRTRTGCWTCRFRKKKCDEARPACEQCTNLKLTCDGYDAQPVWMKDQGDAAAQKKLEIKKQMVRRSRRRKKNQQDPNRSQPPDQKSANLPAKHDEDASGSPKAYIPPRDFGAISLPMQLEEHDFSARLPTSSPEESTTSEHAIYNMRSMNWAVGLPDSANPGFAGTLSTTTSGTLASSQSARDYGVKDETDDEYNDVPDASVDDSTPTSLTPYGARRCLGPSQFQFPDLQIQTDKALDMNLANLYLRTIFGVTYRALSDEQVTQYNNALIVPMFQNNKSFLHGCLSSTALHLTGTNISETQRKGLVTEVYRHRQKSLKSLGEQVRRSANQEERIKIAATVCALISFEVFSRRTDWKMHVKAATDCVILLNWCNLRPTNPGQWFIYSRILWLDILSSITSAAPPVFAEHYRKILFLPLEMQNQVNRLVEMTGCEDSVLYMISEITCLENWKFETAKSQPWHLIQHELERRAEIYDRDLRSIAISGLVDRSPITEATQFNFESVNTSPRDDDDDDDNFTQSEFGDDESLGSEFDVDETFDVEADAPPELNEVVSSIVRRDSSGPALNLHFPYEPAASSPTDTDTGDVFVNDKTNMLIEDRETFRKAVTEAFRIMARVYLRIITHGFNPYDKLAQDLLQELLAVINFIPSLYMGYERSIISPLLIVGSLAINPIHQQIISARLKRTPQMAKYGNLGNVDKILTEVWGRTWARDPKQIVPWRQVMKEKNWEYLMV